MSPDVHGVSFLFVVTVRSTTGFPPEAQDAADKTDKRFFSYPFLFLRCKDGEESRTKPQTSVFLPSVKH